MNGSAAVAAGGGGSFLRRESTRAAAIQLSRFLIAYVALTAVFYTVGAQYSAWWRKPIELVLAALPSPVAIVAVDVDTSSGQRVFQMTGRTRDKIHTARGDVPAGIQLKATTLQAYAHHHVILILAVLVAWPVARASHRMTLLAAGVLAIVPATLLDIPFTLVGVAQETILAASNPHAIAHDAAVLYYQFLQRGGRQVLALVLAGLAIVLSQKHHLRLP